MPIDAMNESPAHFAFHVLWTQRDLRAEVPTVSIPNIDTWIGSELGKVTDVLAVAIVRCEGVRAVFTMVAEHSDEIYDAILGVEARVRATLNSTKLGFSIRSVQGRPLSHALPMGAKVVFSK